MNREPEYYIQEITGTADELVYDVVARCTLDELMVWCIKHTAFYAPRLLTDAHLSRHSDVLCICHVLFGSCRSAKELEAGYNFYQITYALYPNPCINVCPVTHFRKNEDSTEWEEEPADAEAYAKAQETDNYVGVTFKYRKR